MLITRTAISAALLLSALLFIPGSAQAQVAEILIVPVGEGPAFEPTAKMAGVMAGVLNKDAKVPVASLYYPFPRAKKPGKKVLRKISRLQKQLRRAYDQMAYGKAASLADQLRDMEKDLMKAGRRSKGYVAALHYLAAVTYSDGEVKKAFKYMNDAVLFNSKPPPKKVFNADILRLHQRVLAERSAPGKLTLSAMPGGLIWFNGKLHGLADGTVKKPAGLYLIKHFRPGHIRRMRWFRVHPHRGRELSTVLNKDESPEPALIGQLRQEGDAAEPGAAIRKLALEQASIHVVLVGAEKGCNTEQCTVTVAWAEEDLWKQEKKRAALTGDLEKVALKLMPKLKLRPGLDDEDDEFKKKKKKKKIAASPLLVNQCITDSQCSRKQHCETGRCVKFTPVTKKWWFWTIVGGAVAVATVAIAVPLSMPDNPVIEVK